MSSKRDAIVALQAVQRDIAKQDQRIDERNRIMVELHQVHQVRQRDIAAIVTEASDGQKGLTESGVGAAITKTLGHLAGRVPRARPPE